MVESNDLYDDLGVSHNAKKSEIKSAYRRKARETHPDSGGDSEKFIIVYNAYQILSDEDKRAKYDNNGQQTNDLNSIEHLAKNEIMNLIVRFIDQSVEQNVQLNSVDIVNTISTAIEQQLKNISISIKNTEKSIPNLSKYKEHIECNGNNNIFKTMFNIKIDGLKIKLKIEIEKKKILQEAIAILEDYKFTGDIEQIFYSNMNITFR